MSLDRMIITRLIADGATPVQWRDVGVSRDLFLDEGKKAFDWITDYFRKHGALPDAKTFDDALGGFTMDAPAPLSYYVEKGQKRHLVNLLAGGMDWAEKALDKGDNPEEALARLKKVVGDVDKARRASTDLEDMVTTTEERWGQYQYLQNRGSELTGYPLPWPTFNKATLGVNPGELWVFVARLKTGKTFMLSHLAAWFWKQKLPVLYVSMEMSVRRIAARVDAMLFGQPYGDLLRGRLTTAESTAYRAGLVEMSKSEVPFWVVGRGTVNRMSDVEMLITDLKPKVVLIDAIYRMRANYRSAKGSQRWERVGDVINDCQALGLARNVPLLVSTQYNRQLGKNKLKGQAEQIGLSYEIPQNADVVISLTRDLELEAQKRMRLEIIEGRDARPVAIMTHWDLETIVFTEIGEVTDEGLVETGADASGVGVGDAAAPVDERVESGDSAQDVEGSEEEIPY